MAGFADVNVYMCFGMDEHITGVDSTAIGRARLKIQGLRSGFKISSRAVFIITGIVLEADQFKMGFTKVDKDGIDKTLKDLNLTNEVCIVSPITLCTGGTFGRTADLHACKMFSGN